MTYIKKNRRSHGLKIKKYPIAASDAERKSGRDSEYYIGVQPGIAPIFPEAVFLSGIKAFDLLRQFLECLAKVARFDYLHADIF
jgi:hypothetical protein